ncbi:INO80 complex subunit C isoform X2 [Lepisosteus oculatus]|uniref:INO80 complex subunit C isoform X2 n=1 Tax=Lepisosteus oculatus TaxID=7918 RepID=UPI0035F52A48
MDEMSSPVPAVVSLLPTEVAASTSPSPSATKGQAPTPASQARCKKRPLSPATSLGPTSASNSKKKKLSFTSSAVQSQPQVVTADSSGENKSMTSDSSTVAVESTVKPVPFKDQSFVHSGIGGAAAGKKNRTWKNLKQILAAERALPWQLNDPNYCNIDAPPSFKPARKYSDISGLPARNLQSKTAYLGMAAGLGNV